MPRDTDEDLGGGHVDDMTKLTYLNEPGVLYNLKKRYALNEIYVSDSPALFLFTVVSFCICTHPPKCGDMRCRNTLVAQESMRSKVENHHYQLMQ